MKDHIRLLYAPMEGITYSRFRALHYEMFPGADEYFTPFIAPDSKGGFRPKYLKELTADSEVPTVPQLLVNNAEAFNLTALRFHELGFGEINLNSGCPSGTVFSKHKGAGMLADPETLDRTLDGIYSHAEQHGYHVSIKTRMGVHSTSEFPEILDIFNRYPVSRLIIHARCRDAFYQGETDLSGFTSAMESSRCPVVYNGNLFSSADVRALLEKMPAVRSVMLGRGAVANPAVFRELAGGNPLQPGELRIFHDRLMETWLSSGLDARFTAERMKTLWVYWQTWFPNAKKEYKTIMKSKDLPSYLSAVSTLFSSWG